MAHSIESMNKQVQATVTNGLEAASIVVRHAGDAASVALTLRPDDAVEFATAILNAAQNARERKHGSGGQAVYDDPQRAVQALLHRNLPTEPGLYQPNTTATLHDAITFRLLPDGQWLNALNNEPAEGYAQASHQEHGLVRLVREVQA